MVVFDKDIKKRVRGLSLGRINYLMLAVTLIVSALLLVANHKSSGAYSELRVAAEDYIAWHRNADDIQAASDYLTEQARAFAATGDKEYLDNYFYEANTTRRRENALDNIGEMSVGSEESYTALENAVRESYALMETEYYSMRLTVEGYGVNVNFYPQEVVDVELSEEDVALSPEEMKNKAVTILFDGHYQNSKTTISGHVKACLDDMDKDYVDKQQNAADNLSFMFHYEQVLVIAYVVIVLAIISLITFKVLVPLSQAIPCIKADKKVPTKGAYEYRYLAETYNKMYDVNKEHKEQLMKEATHDALTGVYNRREFKQILDRDEKTIFAIVLFDVDRFKQVNDVNGHDVGDVVLTKVSKKIEEIYEDLGYTCRIGGDEIAVIISDRETDKEIIYRRAVSLNDAISVLKDIPKVTVSAGIAYYEEGMETNTLFKHADRALYMTKRNMRGGCTVYNTQE